MKFSRRGGRLEAALKSVVVLCLCAFTGAFSPGCASGGSGRPAGAPASGATRIEVLGDWDDVRSSVGVGLSQVGIAPLRVNSPEPDRLEYALRTPRDEPGRLTLERLAPAHEPDPVAIAITCSIGRFGDPEREAQLVARIRRRLEQLRGVEIAPIRR
ncbi:MAG TPA: hypothetical protein VFF69_08535 [Phycisphaerales bacterium]|nr:hypothetical protein [Phycisphaerales bacterium]